MTDILDPDCLERWPEAHYGDYDPRCCRFPKSCSPEVMVEALLVERADLRARVTELRTEVLSLSRRLSDVSDRLLAETQEHRQTTHRVIELEDFVRKIATEDYRGNSNPHGHEAQILLDEGEGEDGAIDTDLHFDPSGIFPKEESPDGH